MKKTILSVMICINLLSAFDAEDLKQLKEEDECPMCDLSYADLRGIDLSMSNLSDANLSHANLTNVLAHKARFLSCRPK